MIGGLFLASLALGVAAYAKYISAEQTIASDLAAITERGKTSTVEQCVGETLVWRKGCGAMVSLCDMSVGRIMSACLGAQSRLTYCSALDASLTETTFGVQECKDRGAHENRADKKVCATAYRTVSAHCQRIQREATEGKATR